MAEKTPEEKKGSKQAALAPWRPFEEFDRWLEGPFWSRRFPRRMREMFEAGQGELIPAMDVREKDKQYAITIELPGVGKEDVHVELEGGLLTVRGEKTSEREDKKEHRHYTERSYGSFTRSLRLPSDADADRLEASFKDGVLAVTIPRTEAAKPRAIAIKA